MMMVFQPIIQGSQDCSDWTCVHTSVRVPANVAVDGAGIKTSPATNTKQALTQWTLENLAAPVVENNKVKLLRAV